MKAANVLTLALAARMGLVGQSPSTTIAGVDEPPELSGPGKHFTPPSPTLVEFGKIMQNVNENDREKTSVTRSALSHFIEDHSTFSPAYGMRAMCDFCLLASENYDVIEKDVQKALNTLSPELGVFSSSDLLALRAKIRFEQRRFAEALDDLELAIKTKLDTADKVFGSAGTKPETTNPNPCIWTTANLDTFGQNFPRDYRVPLLRGLYLTFFTTFEEKLYQPAIQQLQQAALLNPRSTLPPYFLGELYFKASFWTKAAWESDEGRNMPIRKAIVAYNKAIELDRAFRPAYEKRASCYEQLKQFHEAIQDYDRVLELDDKNVTAYADRGLAELEIGNYIAATSDLGRAIELKGDDSETLSMSYEYRGDAYGKMGMYREAIDNYSKAIKCQLANQTFLMSLKQFRELYPEYDKVSDEVLIRRINALFWPQFDYATMSKQLLERTSEYKIGSIHSLYEKRGDCYLRNGDYRRSALDFNRIFKGIPDFASTIDRWRLLGGKPGEEWYLDVKSAEFGTAPRLWAKFIHKDKTLDIQSFDFDCKGRRLATTSVATYDKDGNLLGSNDSNSGWQRVIPDSLGEQIFNGMCGEH